MYTQRPHTTSLHRALTLIAVSALSAVACDQADQAGRDAQPRAPLPPNTSDDTPLSSLGRESGMSGDEVCRLMTSELVDLLSTDSGAHFTCGVSALAASFGVPEGGGEICDVVYQECRNNYTVAAECDERVLTEIDRCALPAGLWRSCIDEQYAAISAAGQLNFSCGDLPGYASGLEAIGKRYPTPACDEIQRSCPGLNTSSSADDAAGQIPALDTEGTDDFNDGDDFNDDFNDDFDDDFDDEEF